MARKNFRVAFLLRYLVLGLALGAGVGAGSHWLYRYVMPQQYEARALLLHAPGETDFAPDAAQIIRSTLERPHFLPDVVERIEVDKRTAALLARRLRVVETTDSKHLAHLVLHGRDRMALETGLNAVADEMVSLYLERERRHLQNVLRRLDAELVAVTQHHTALEARHATAAPLPIWARGAVVMLTDLAKQRFELQLQKRYPTTRDTPASLDERLAELSAQEARLHSSLGGDENVEAARLNLELELALDSAKLLALLQTKQQILNAIATQRGPLRVVQHARSAPASAPAEQWVLPAVVGAAIGGMFVLLLWWLRRPAQIRLTGPVVETDLRVRVIGVMASSITHYGERKLRPLAQVHPDHLAIAGVRSLAIALHILGKEQARVGPVVVVEHGGDRHAAHVLANLAMLAADRGERVLLVDAVAVDSGLSAMFKSGTQTTLSTSLGSDDLGPAQIDGRDGHRGRIRFVNARASQETVEAGELPVPGAFVNYFDRVYMHAQSISQACALLDGYGAGLGILVGSNRQRLAPLREARRMWQEQADTLHGIVLCGYQIDESAYAA